MAFEFMTQISPENVRSDLYSFSSSQECKKAQSSRILSVLSSLLNRAVARNDKLSASSSPTLSRHKYGIFNAGRVPDISVEQYLGRIFQHTDGSLSVFVVAYAYIDRLCELHSEFRIGSLNVHRLLITSIMVASKFVEDRNHRNSYYARVGGLPVAKLNELEMVFLFMMGFKLQVTVSVFESYCSHLEREVAMGGGYQIERTLRLVCGIDKQSRSKQGNRCQPKLRLTVI